VVEGTENFARFAPSFVDEFVDAIVAFTRCRQVFRWLWAEETSCLTRMTRGMSREGALGDAMSAILIIDCFLKGGGGGQ